MMKMCIRDRFYGEAIHPFYDKAGFENALNGKNCARPDRIAVCAMDGTAIMGMAGCSEDAPGWLQIGVDVMPAYRSRRRHLPCCLAEKGNYRPRRNPLLRHQPIQLSLLDVYKRQEQAQVTCQSIEIGEGHKIMAEIGGVIPDVQPRGNLRPRFEILQEAGLLPQCALGPAGAIGCGIKRFAAASVQRMGEAAFDRAEADDYIVPGPDGPGRFAGILISKGVNQHMGMIDLNGFGNLVDEADHRTGRAALRFIQRLSLIHI